MIKPIGKNITKQRFRCYYSLVLVFLLLVASSQTTAATTCNSFPKIFGGNSSNSYFCQFDVYSDYLAMAGDT